MLERIINRALIRRQMIASCEREPFILSVMMGVLVLCANTLGHGVKFGVISGVIVLSTLLFVCYKAGKADPQMFMVAIRSMRYRKFYPSQGRPKAEPVEIKDF